MNTKKPLVAAFVVGFVFALGLAISGMTLPTKVIGFLDFGGAWDPTLAFVMGGAVTVYAIGFRWVTRREKPTFVNSFSIPSRTDITPRLIGGSVLFGLGWGLGGFCPGPALTSIPTGLAHVGVFVIAMLAGMYLFGVLERAIEKKRASHTEGEQEKEAIATSH